MRLGNHARLLLPRGGGAAEEAGGAVGERGDESAEQHERGDEPGQS
ncbi:MAG TPA: hypothetical protein VF546_17455 [Pyrinomonadaceae bacterium]